MDIVPDGILDRSSPEPLYIQIKNWMFQEIDSGRWPVHYKLPAEEDLARAIGVNRGTLRQAQRELIAAGKLTQIHGKGTFVASAKHLEQPLADHLISFSEDLISRDIPFETQVLEQGISVPSQRVALLLGISTSDAIFGLKRVRIVGGMPLCVLHNYVVLQRCPTINTVDFTRHRLFETIEELYGLEIDWGRRTFEARTAQSAVAEQLRLPVGDPVMYIEQVVYLADGSPIEMSDVWFPGDYFRLSATVRRRTATKLDAYAEPQVMVGRKPDQEQ